MSLRTLGAALLGASLVLPAGGALAEAEFNLRFGIANPPQEFHHAWTPHVVFAQEVEARSGGRIQVELFPGGQLGGIESMVNQVRQGIIQAADPAEGHFATTYPAVQVFSIPYLFPNREVAWEVLDGEFGQAMIEDMAEKTGMRPLFWSENGGFRHFSNNVRQVRSPEDMQGLKIRTMNIPLHMTIVENLGASPTPVAWAELYTALQTGVVEGQENSIATFLVPKLEEVQDYIVLDGHVYSVNTVILNEDWYQSLPDDLKNVIHQAAHISLAVNRGLTISNEIKGIDYLRERGVDIYAPTAEEHARFREATQEPALAWLRNEVDAEWIDGILAATAEAEKKWGYR
jgi:TRAP-type transport system periplasmic protein